MATWNHFGLGVAASFALLGSSAIIHPQTPIELFGVAKGPLTATNAATIDKHAFSILIGGRDLALAASMFVLARENRSRELGTVILSTLVVCLPDLYLVWRNRKYPELIVMSIGTLGIGLIGAGLRGLL